MRPPCAHGSITSLNQSDQGASGRLLRLLLLRFVGSIMQIATWVGTGASILGLAAAIWAAIRAQGAASAARQARDELRRLQAPWSLLELQSLLYAVRNAIRDNAWPTCEVLTRWARDQIAEIAQYLQEELADEEFSALQGAIRAVGRIDDVALQYAEQGAGNPSRTKHRQAIEDVNSALGDIAAVRGAMRRRGEESRGG